VVKQTQAAVIIDPDIQWYQPPSPPAIVAKPKGKRAMDSFLEELKRYVMWKSQLEDKPADMLTENKPHGSHASADMVHLLLVAV
jgi:hypothetical protein